jgi:hypothetical protein
MAEKKGFPGQMRVFSTIQCLVHWLIVVDFTLLVLTSLPLYLDSPLAQGDSSMSLRQWHRIGVVGLLQLRCPFCCSTPGNSRRHEKDLYLGQRRPGLVGSSARVLLSGR